MAIIDDTVSGNPLIESDRVEGTAVYGQDNKKIGTIERVMIDKKSGQVSYAVLGFGGFLGIGHDHYPLPWKSFRYDEKLGGYITNVDESMLKAAPKYASDNDWDWADSKRRVKLDEYYLASGW